MILQKTTNYQGTKNPRHYSLPYSKLFLRTKSNLVSAENPEHLCKQNCYRWVNRQASVSPG